MDHRVLYYRLISGSQVTVEAAAGPGYSGVRKNDDVGGMIATATEAQIGGGTYLHVYNPSQFMGQLTSGNTNYGIQSDESGTYTGNLFASQSPKMQ